MSRVKSARDAKGAKGAKSAKAAGKPAKAGAPRTPAGKRPAPGGRPGVFVQKPKSDIYVALLSIALGAILIGSLLLILQLNAVGFNLKAA